MVQKFKNKMANTNNDKLLNSLLDQADIMEDNRYSGTVIFSYNTGLVIGIDYNAVSHQYTVNISQNGDSKSFNDSFTTRNLKTVLVDIFERIDKEAKLICR